MNKTILIYLFFFFALSSRAAITLPSFFNSNMVLQQQSNVPLWGWELAGKKVKVVTSWNNKSYSTMAGKDGKWEVVLPTPGAGGPYSIEINGENKIVLNNVLIGEVWFCSGQSNMEMPMEGFDRAQKQPIKNSEELIRTSANKNIRLFTVKRADSSMALNNCTGQWEEASPPVVRSFSAVAYQYARMLQEKLQVPVGIISSSWGGTPIEAWMPKEALNAVMTKHPTAFFQKRRSGLYNAMVHPLKNYGIKGFLWYQGESNKVNANIYTDLMTAMVNDWRHQWQNETLPFYFVQIAPLQSNNKNAGQIPYLWEAQAKALQTIPYSGMAVINDAGEKNSIHPADKETVARRLCLLALAKSYGQKQLAYSGPVYKKMKLVKDTAYLFFDHAENGLTDKHMGLSLFEVAGEDKIFHKAEAFITPNGVTVFSKDVKNPVAVRYAFNDWVIGELHNAEGLPASAFRTDDW